MRPLQIQVSTCKVMPCRSCKHAQLLESCHVYVLKRVGLLSTRCLAVPHRLQPCNLPGCSSITKCVKEIKDSGYELSGLICNAGGPPLLSPATAQTLPASSAYCCHGAATVLPPCCHCAATVLPSCCHRAAIVLPSCCHCAATVLPSCCHRAAIVLPPCCHCAATVLPLCCHRAATVLPSCCHRAATVLPLCCHCAAIVLPSCCHRAATVLPSGSCNNFPSGKPVSLLSIM